MTYRIATEYKDNTLLIEVDPTTQITLVINGVERNRKTVHDASLSCYLDSVVQVGYEEHEQIEGRVVQRGDSLTVAIYGNGVELKSTELRGVAT